MSSETPRVLTWPVVAAEVAAAPCEPGAPGNGESVGTEASGLAPVLSLTRRRQQRPTDPTPPGGAADDGVRRRRGMADHPARAD